MEFAPQHVGERAGLLVFGADYAWIGVERAEGHRSLVLRGASGAPEGGEERLLAARELGEGVLRLRVDWRSDARCVFSASVAGGDFEPLGPLFATTPLPQGSAGHAGFAWFRVLPLLP